jgi:hypothetical protein
MRWIVYIALWHLLGPSGAAGEDSYPFKHPIAAHLIACPDGHKALVDVPIVWGLVGPLFKKPADYDDEDRALMLKAERGEIVLGGDCLPEDPPKTQVACRQCGFRYVTMDLPLDYPKNTYWSKSGKKPEEFRIKFSETLLSLPLLKPQKGSISYWQSLKADGKQLDDERVIYRTSLPFDRLLKALRQWLSEHQRNPADLKPLTLQPEAPSPPADPFSPPAAAKSDANKSGPAAVQDTPGRRFFEYDDRSVWLTLQDDWYWNPGQVEISLRIKRAVVKPVEVGRK